MKWSLLLRWRGEGLIGKVFCSYFELLLPFHFFGVRNTTKKVIFLMGKLFHLTTIRERRVLTPVGWVTLSMAFGCVLVLIILFVHPFLAPTKPVEGGVLVVEAWVADYLLEVKELFEKGKYELIVIIGRKYGVDHPLAHYSNSANWTVSKFKDRGIPEEKIVPIWIAIYPKKDRTYHKALVAKKRLNEVGFTQASIDVVSFGVHARRTWLLFEKVFSSVAVGVIAIRPENYDTSRWWLFSEGVRSVIAESVAYLYARFIFSPSI